ncbi:hypothetical protein CYMTET_33649 [Cymbomonas tetramitiformis]|uniref:Uncharacterized protein n=1 Tax=Cymbomonas tetramitiformis TaxID=36881 RepID=A0AAE0KQN6_9CHLO|nr:hypothetical protein CYMTET_33649 [Cymbomonas tetramitiformis]
MGFIGPAHISESSGSPHTARSGVTTRCFVRTCSLPSSFRSTKELPELRRNGYILLLQTGSRLGPAEGAEGRHRVRTSSQLVQAVSLHTPRAPGCDAMHTWRRFCPRVMWVMCRMSRAICHPTPL